MENSPATASHLAHLDASVLAALLRVDRPLRVHHEPWHRSTHDAQSASSCAYCSADLSRAAPREAIFSYLVPLTLGAPGVSANRVLACASCAQSRFGTDLLAWPRLSRIPQENREALLSRRALMLRQAGNHLTPHSRYAKQTAVLHHLENRFAHPRFRAFAYVQGDQAWIGWRAHKGEQRDKQGPAAILRWGHQAVSIGNGKAICFRLPASSFLDAVWDLIEHNGLILPLVIEGQPSAVVDPNDWRSSWSKTFTRVSDLARRKSRRYKEVAPSPPVIRSDKPSAISRRRSRAKQKEQRQQVQAELNQVALWREYEKAFADYQALVRSRKAQATPLIPIEEMRRRSLEVMALKCRAQGLPLPKGYREPA